MIKLRTLTAAALAFAAASAFAQPGSASAATPRVDQRQANQEKRIDQGIASGELTKRETRRLEKEQNVIGRAENHAKADGTVTKPERPRLHKMQQHASRDIRRQTHDAQGPRRGAGPALARGSLRQARRRRQALELHGVPRPPGGREAAGGQHPAVNEGTLSTDEG